MKNTEKTMDKIVALCKNRGFIFAGSEIYGGLANTWDYGPLGVELKNNVKRAWWKKFVQENPYNVGQDAAILMNPQTWVASGHLSGFSDPLMDCRECKERFRADKLIEDWCQQEKVELPKPIDAFTQQEMKDFIEEHNIPCPSCGKHNFTDIRQFNLMFKTFQGVTEDAKNTVYLRPETAQGIFTNFVNTQRTTRRKLPFGVCQIGKSFRNEITPGNFIFRVREFEQMELEFFCKPGTDLEWFQYWRSFCHNWLLSIGLKDENLRLRDHDPEELCFYSKATTDFEFLFPFGWGELWGVADRTDYDLTQHQNTSGKDLTYFDQEANEHYVPYVIEPSLGCDRVARNGDAANKIGTSAVAILAKHYGIPFYVCAPSSTIDMSLASGAEIPIEQRAAEEVTEMWYKKRMAPEGVGVYNPAFDVTDHSLITGIITERGICTAPFEDAFGALGF